MQVVQRCSPERWEWRLAHPVEECREQRGLQYGVMPDRGFWRYRFLSIIETVEGSRHVDSLRRS
jgi:hypothetical protein